MIVEELRAEPEALPLVVAEISAEVRELVARVADALQQVAQRLLHGLHVHELLPRVAVVRQRQAFADGKTCARNALRL